jgi:hypothetical protein
MNSLLLKAWQVPSKKLVEKRRGRRIHSPDDDDDDERSTIEHVHCPFTPPKTHIIV